MKLEEKFYVLLNKWQEESCFLSSTSDMKKCPGFQPLVNLGWFIVPLMLNKLGSNDSYDNFWFIMLLFEITGENPVLEPNKGHIARMAQDWVNWGKEKGVI